MFTIFFVTLSPLAKNYVFFLVTLSPLAKNYVSIVKIVTSGSLGPLLPFFKARPKLNKNVSFLKWYFLLFSLFTLGLLVKKYVSITIIVTLSPLGHFCPQKLLKAPFKRAPKLINIIFFLHSFVALSQHTNILYLYAHNYVFKPLEPFLKIKGPLKEAEMHIYNGVIKTLCAKNAKVCKSIGMKNYKG